MDQAIHFNFRSVHSIDKLWRLRLKERKNCVWILYVKMPIFRFTHNCHTYGFNIQWEKSVWRPRRKKNRGIIKIDNALISLKYSFTITNRESIWRIPTTRCIFTTCTKPNKQKRPDECILRYMFLFSLAEANLFRWHFDLITCFFFACIHLSGKSFSFPLCMHTGKWMASSCRRLPL